MPENPERMRPTNFSYSPIVQEANIIVLKEASKVIKESQGKFNKKLSIAAQRFLANTLLDKE